MAFLLSALVLLALIAGSVTINDAVRAPHWRQVAVERRRSWRERTGYDEPDADDDEHEDRDDEPGDDGSGNGGSGSNGSGDADAGAARVRGAASFSSARA